MARTRNTRARSRSAGRRFMYLLLLAMLVGDIALFVAARADEDPGTSPAPQQTNASAQPQEDEEGEAESGEPQPCAELSVPQEPPEPVTCRSRTATLTIAHQADPVLLGGTHARLLSARFSTPTAITAKLRIRNETEAEQGVAAGGQEIYLNAAGTRIDHEPLDDVRVPVGEAVNAELRFELGEQSTAVRRQGGRVELGVTPWQEPADSGERRIGVIRARVR